jgi:hypothetical protein
LQSLLEGRKRTHRQCVVSDTFEINLIKGDIIWHLYQWRMTKLLDVCPVTTHVNQEWKGINSDRNFGQKEEDV